MDTRPQLARTARGALIGGALLIVGATLLGAGLAAGLVVYLTKPRTA